MSAITRTGSKQAFDITELLAEENQKTFTVLKEEEGLRLDLFLRKRLPWMSRSRLQRLTVVRTGVEADSSEKNRLKKSVRISEGDRFEVTIPRDPKDLEDARSDPPLKELEKLYEDEAILAINKPAGVPVHPVGRNLHRTVLAALHQRYRRPLETERDVVPRLVHRLDLETSGVLLVAKKTEALRDLAEQFRRRSVKKEYLAVVYGRITETAGEIDLPLGPDETSKVPYKRRVDRENGCRAVTRYTVIDSCRGLTWVRLEPLTGRKHQLRVHMAILGHPIVGDKIYGPDEKYYFKARVAPPDRNDLEELLLPRQALHASRLTFTHPGQMHRLMIEASAPAAFDSLR